MNEAEVYAAPRDYEALMNALDARRVELGLSQNDLDRITGVASGYSGKAFGPSRTKKIGWLSTFEYLDALGLEIRLVADDVAAKRYAERALKRNGRQARPDNHAAPVSDRVFERALRRLGVLDWNEALAAVGDARRKIAAEKAAREAKAEAAPAPPRAAAAAYDGPDRRGTRHAGGRRGEHCRMAVGEPARAFAPL